MENVTIEYKRELTDELEKEIVAFLNTLGGEVHIGKDADGSICGVSNADELCLKIADRLKNNIKPSIMGLFQVEVIEGDKSFVKISVAGGIEKPYYVNKYGMCPKGCFIRIGTQSSPMVQSQIDNMYSKRVIRTLSTTVATRQDLSFQQLRIFYEENGFDTNGVYFLKNLGFYTENEKFNYLAMLLSDQSDASIKLARFKGKDKTEIVTNKDFGYCCLLKSVYNVLEAIDNYNYPYVKITYPNRVEKFLVDKIALREAVINAIVHNDYLRGFPMFEIYDDRINIVSCGGLPNNLTEEEFFGGFSMPRNRELMRVFRDMRLVENFGSGLRRILNVYGRYVFRLSDNFVCAEFAFDANATINATINATANVYESLTKLQNDIIKVIEKNANATYDAISKQLNKDRTTIYRNIQELKRSGRIERVGSSKAGYWKIV